VPVSEHTLRERKQQRARDAIITAAYELFAERGYLAVTVTDIAERAEVGRTTFFRYFADKQELLFADDDELQQTLTETLDAAAQQRGSIGDSLEDAIGIARVALLAMADMVARRAAWLPLRQKLITTHPALTARSLTKERQYAQTAVELLVQHGATLETAVLAVGLATACYQTAEATTAHAPDQLPAASDAAFQRLAKLDRTTLLARLA
jgi:AcrR family transcriptional regulator